MSIHRRIFWALLALLSLAVPATTSTMADRAHAAVTAPVTKVLVFMEENHSLNEMASMMPYTFSLAKQYGYATNYHAITHPSLPNYLAIAGGSTFGISDDASPNPDEIGVSGSSWTERVRVAQVGGPWNPNSEQNRGTLSRYAV